MSQTFQPSIKHFEINAIDYGSLECEHVSKHRYSAKATSNHKGNLSSGNSVNRLGTAHTALSLFRHHQKEFLAISMNMSSFGK